MIAGTTNMLRRMEFRAMAKVPKIALSLFGMKKSRSIEKKVAINEMFKSMINFNS